MFKPVFETAGSPLAYWYAWSAAKQYRQEVAISSEIEGADRRIPIVTPVLPRQRPDTAAAHIKVRP